jgi:hypothetical protein
MSASCNTKGSTSMSQDTDANTTKLSRRAALAGLTGVAAAAGAIPAIGGEADPIFAAIAAHRTAANAYAADDAEDIDGLMWAAQEALENLLETTPTTLPGVVALLRHLGEPDVGHDPDYTLLARVLSDGGVFDVQDAASDLPNILANVISQNIGGGR